MFQLVTQGDSLLLIDSLRENSIDMVITSPPYNVDLGNNKYHKESYDLYNDNREHTEYIGWLKSIFEKLYYRLKSGGRVAINIGDRKNGAIPTHVDIIYFMSRQLNYIPMTTIIWNKSQIGNRTSWGSWLSPSCPSFPTPFEYIMVFAKETTKRRDKGEATVSRDEFIKNSLAMWTMAPETKQKAMGHTAMFPVELPYRLLQQLTYRYDVVVDPFAGLGTTGVACKKLDRNFIGFELSADYAEKANKRISETQGGFEQNG